MTSYIEPISPQDTSFQDNIFYFGFDEHEVQNGINDSKSRKLSTPFLGDPHNAVFKAYPNLGEEYIVVFKAREDDTFMRQMSYLFSEEEGQLIVNANGSVYRFLVNEKSCVSTDYELPHTVSANYYSLSSTKYKIMIIATYEGLVAINWEKELWSNEVEYAYCGYLELVKINDNYLLAEHYCPNREPISLFLTLDILTGKLIKEEEHKGRWYYQYFDKDDKALMTIKSKDERD